MFLDCVKSVHGAIEPGEGQIPVAYQDSSAFIEILQHLQVFLILSTYQAGKVLVIASHAGKLTILFLDYDRRMGLAIGPDRIAIGAGASIYFLRSSHATLATVRPTGCFDDCYVAHSSRHTGRILGHDLCWGHEGLWVLKALLPCLCTLDDAHSSVPRWNPPSISQLTDENRCQLNGKTLDVGAASYVTALAEKHAASRWRANEARTGKFMDVRSGEVLSRGLCMQHSPQVRNGQLIVVNSGHGNLSKVDRRTGRMKTVKRVGAFPTTRLTRTRCDCSGRHSFVLPKRREYLTLHGTHWNSALSAGA